jgi:hypothetical protein
MKQKHHAGTATSIADYFPMRTITAGECVRMVLCWVLWLAARLEKDWCCSPIGKGVAAAAASARVIGRLF